MQQRQGRVSVSAAPGPVKSGENSKSLRLEV